jgi:glycosyltransferase involved in cell wall biosynthesis
MKISFVIATYNRPKALDVLLYSLLGQDSDAWDAIVMDEDGESGPKYAVRDSRITHRPTERHRIPSWNERGSLGYLPKHVGASLVGGDFLCFASEDIYYLPDFVSSMLKCAERNDIIGCDVLINRVDCTNILPFFPRVGGTDGANYIIRPEWYHRNPFTTFFPDEIGVADGRTPELCVQQGARWSRVGRVLVVHGEARP